MRRDRQAFVAGMTASLAVLFCQCAGIRGPIPGPASQGSPGGFAAEYRLSWAGRDGRRKARLAAAFSAPRRLRIEVLDPLGSSRALLVATEAGALLLDPSRKEFRTYREGREALRDLSGMALDPGLLASLLLGDPAAAPGMECLPAEGEAPGSRICRGSGGDPIVRIARGGAEWEIDRPGAEVLHVEMKIGTGSPPGPPRWLRLRGAADEGSAELELRDFRAGPPPQDLFSLQPPVSFHDASGDPAHPGEGWSPP